VASMAIKVGLIGDFTNKSFKSTSIFCMIAMNVPNNVIQTITRYKNWKDLKRYSHHPTSFSLASFKDTWRSFLQRSFTDEYGDVEGEERLGTNASFLALEENPIGSDVII
jgi:hypothetical protein